MALYDCGISGNDKFPKQEKVSTNKPLLEDVINTVESYLKTRNLPNVGYNIELKSTEKGDNAFHPAPEEFSDIVARLLSANLDKIRYTIQCFDFRILNYWHKSYPETTLVALVSNNKGLEANLNELDFVPSAYSPNHSLVNQALINDCHAKSMKIIPWTVNNLQRMEELVEMGVDGIITDYPDIAKALK